MLGSLCDVRWWQSAPTVGLSLLCAENSLSPPLPTQHLKPVFACSTVPRLLAFLARPLSNPREEADGPGFLCTNQGGICSLTDTSPLTHVSSHIHYSFSLRWAAVKGRVQSGGWGADGVVVMGGWWALVLCSSCQLMPVFECPSVLHTKKEGSRVTFRSNHCTACLHSLTLLLPVLGFQWRINDWVNWE